MIIRGIFTNTKLSPTRMNSETTVPYIVANECPGLKRGDLVQLVGYDSKFQVVWTYASSREQESYETVTISEINGKQINTMGKNISSMEQFGNMNVDNVFGDLTKHGNGYNPYSMDLDTYFTLEEPSNTDDGPQGEFKTGPFDYPLFKRAVERHCLDNYSETYHCKFNIVITHWDCLKTKYIPTICDYQDKSPRIIGIIRFIEQLRTSNCIINDIYLGKSEDSDIKEL